MNVKKGENRMLKLYALKCKRGYIRYSSDSGCTCVGLEKATVFNCPDQRELVEAQRYAVAAGMESLRVVELQIAEKDYDQKNE